ncbi:MAG: DNA-binding protein [Dysgonamonadaceae bacterium]|nr:DNA-binding protein [Dysgonamonadaceae bacterium]
MKKNFILLLLFLSINRIPAQQIEKLWASSSEESRPWVFWYWMQGAVSKEGITADLEAMKEVGLGGAYLMPIKGAPEKPFITPVVEQLSPLWWEMVDFAFKEADRVGIKIGFHVCDGFALAGGPWITPERAMQKVVWSRTNIQGGKKINLQLPQPESYKDYYEDIAVFACPALPGEGLSSEKLQPKVTTNVPGVDAQFLTDINTKESFSSKEPCWILFAFDEPFTCRTIQVQPSGRNFQAQRFTVEAGDDGIHFKKISQLEAPRQGWQNDDFPMTHAIPPTTARYFRFLYDLEGTEPGSEDLDVAKWKQSLKIKYIRLSSEARIHQYEGKNGSVWRVSPRTTPAQIPDELCVDKKKIKDVTRYTDKFGRLQWDAPEGEWTILRMGHTSTGHTNATGGKGSGLECDKFNPEAIRLQFDSWFGKAYEVAGKDLASRVLKIFHVDSWECGSQNWSPVFRKEFKKRRGYDIYDYLPVMAGIPVGDAASSEKVLYDVRQTIAELLVDVFYKTLQQEANAKGCLFSAECVAPTMLSDGMMHHKYTDIPMGEFWLQSPTHDKPNDVLDAVSGAHIYGKNIVQAEGFTQLRSTFTEHPAMLKTLQDRNYALGINRLSYHVNVLNPWLNKQPGMTLDGIGLYFQRDQTWWKQAKAWVDYTWRCQALLQFGEPVVDLAVFTGDELPRRAILPDRLAPFIPGIFGKEKMEKEKIRLANAGTPSTQMPAGVSYSANILHAEDWVNALRGYAYDSFNPDVLALAKVVDKQIVLPSGMKYRALIVPGKHPMQPNPEVMTETTRNQLNRLAKQGAKFIELPYTAETFASLGIERDFDVRESTGEYAADIAYTHRRDDTIDIYFISNQTGHTRELSVSLRVTGKIPAYWNPVDGRIRLAENPKTENGRTILSLQLDADESVFIVLQKPSGQALPATAKKGNHYEKIMEITSPWHVRFDTVSRGPEQAVVFEKLTEWNEHPDERIRYYSGTAVYTTRFEWEKQAQGSIFIELENIYNMAGVKINGTDCGILWTKPYRLDITKALRPGSNVLEIQVSNTWANRIMGDENFNAESDENKKIWTNARYRLAEKRLVKSGLTGKITLFHAQ